jgi:hypothetical protein
MMIEMSCQVTGLDVAQQVLAALTVRVQQLGTEALSDEMVSVMAESFELCPFKEGSLRESGRLSEPEIAGSNVTFTLSYGGDDVVYALIQHERLDFNHADGKQAKYLEQPLVEWTKDGPQDVMQRIADEASI